MRKIAQPAQQQLCVDYFVQRDGVGGILPMGIFIPIGSIITGIYQYVVEAFVPINTPLCSIGNDNDPLLYVPEISFIPGSEEPTAMPTGVTGWIIYNYPQSDGLEWKLFVTGGKFSAGRSVFIIQYLPIPIIT